MMPRSIDAAMDAATDAPVMFAARIALTAADRARGALMRGICRFRGLRPFVVDQRRRLIAIQVGALLGASVLALRLPLVSLWLGAALFGVPHVIAGVRAVAIRGRVSRVTLTVAALGGLVGIAQVVGAGDGALRAFVALFAVAIAWEIQGARRHPLLTAAALGALGAVAAAAFASPQLAVLALAHLHGLASLAYFAISARRRRLPVWPLVIGAVVLGVLGASGALDAAMAATLYAPRGAARSIVAEAVGSALPHASMAVFRRALFLYAFGQSLHFAVWLKLLPEVDRQAPVPKPFRRAFLDFAADFKAWALPLLVLAPCAVGTMLMGGGVARELYFALTYFHVGLEAAALARIGLGRREEHPRARGLPEPRAVTAAPAVEIEVAA
jgi:hypothetical protein